MIFFLNFLLKNGQKYELILHKKAKQEDENCMENLKRELK